MTLPDGRLGHAELSLGTGLITLGLITEPTDAPPVADTRAPLPCRRRARARRGRGAQRSSRRPAFWGLRQAIVADPGRHLWELSAHVRDVPPADWGAKLIDP